MRILVVEDDKKIASLVIRGMQEAGFVVDNAEDGEDALHLALSASYDAAIMDVMLPKLDGLSIIARMPQRKTLTPVMPCWRESKIDQGNERRAG